MNKFIDFLEDAATAFQNFTYQLITPTVSMEYVIENDGSWSANDFLTDKYVYYWIGDFKNGQSVKVKSLDAIRYAYRQLRMDMTDSEK